MGKIMKINNQDINIDDLISDKYMHKKLDNGLFLSDYQIEVLLRNDIDPNKCGSINELIYLIDEALEESIDEELDIVSKEIIEFNYYNNTNK